MSDSEERAKREVGYRAVDTFVRPGTCIGLGTGSTAKYAVERVGTLVRDGMSLRVVATSHETERLCREWDIPLVGLGDEPLDVAIDGADEVAPDWSLIKGGGGALFREKAVAIAARAFVIVVTDRKLVPVLGAFPLPVEVVPFSAVVVAREIAALGASVSIRERDGRPIPSDNGNTLLDCAFGNIVDPRALDRTLREIHWGRDDRALRRPDDTRLGSRPHRRRRDGRGTVDGRWDARLMATLTRLEHPVWSLITIVALALFIALFVMSVFEAPNRGL